MAPRTRFLTLPLSAIADRGYFNGEQILQCDEADIVPLVLKPLTSSGITRGLFSKQDFFYNAEHDHYVCLARQELTKAAHRSDRDAMAIRRRTVEHPFGTLKAWMGATHFLTKTLAKVKTEISLHIPAYNIKRMIQMFGVCPSSRPSEPEDLARSTLRSGQITKIIACQPSKPFVASSKYSFLHSLGQTRSFDDLPTKSAFLLTAVQV